MIILAVKKMHHGNISKTQGGVSVDASILQIADRVEVSFRIALFPD